MQQGEINKNKLIKWYCAAIFKVRSPQVPQQRCNSSAVLPFISFFPRQLLHLLRNTLVFLNFAIELSTQSTQSTFPKVLSLANAMPEFRSMRRRTLSTRNCLWVPCFGEPKCTIKFSVRYYGRYQELGPKSYLSDCVSFQVRQQVESYVDSISTGTLLYGSFYGT